MAVAGNLEHLDREPLEELLLRIPARAAAAGTTTDRPVRAARGHRGARQRHRSPSPCLRRAGTGSQPRSRPSHRRRSTRTCSEARWDRACMRTFASSVASATGSTGACGATRTRRFYRLAAACGHPTSPRPTWRIEAIVTDLREHGPSEEESVRARSYAGGSAALGFESTRARADHAVELIMEYGDHDVDPVRHLRAIESVTRKDLAEVAAQVEPGPCVGCVGPGHRRRPHIAGPAPPETARAAAWAILDSNQGPPPYQRGALTD